MIWSILIFLVFIINNRNVLHCGAQSPSRTGGFTALQAGALGHSAICAYIGFGARTRTAT